MGTTNGGDGQSRIYYPYTGQLCRRQASEEVPHVLHVLSPAPLEPSLKHGVAQMSKGKSSQDPQNGDFGIFKGLILLSLPVLRFQQAMLPKIRSGLEEGQDGIVGAVEHFVSFELHALMMLLDPTGKLRNRFDDSDLKDQLKPVLDNVAAGVISFVKAQEDILPPLIKLLDGIRSGEQTNGKK